MNAKEFVKICQSCNAKLATTMSVSLANASIRMPHEKLSLFLKKTDFAGNVSISCHGAFVFLTDIQMEDSEKDKFRSLMLKDVAKIQKKEAEI